MGDRRTSLSEPAGVMPTTGERPRGWIFFSSGPARPALSRLKTSMLYSRLSSSRSQMMRWARDFSSLFFGGQRMPFPRDMVFLVMLEGRLKEYVAAGGG
jgi:hypothetical protein